MTLKIVRERGLCLCSEDSLTAQLKMTIALLYGDRVIDSFMTFHFLTFVSLRLFTTAMEMKLSTKPLESILVNLFMFGRHTIELHLFLYLMMLSDFGIFLQITFHSN